MRGAILALLLMAAACGPTSPIPDEDLFRFMADATEIELGRGFPLTVVRVWAKGLEPEWSDDALEPLDVKLQETTRREDDRRVEETRRYLAYAFSPGEITVSHPAISGEPLVVHILTELDPSDPGPPELPGEPLTGAWPWTILALGGAAALAALSLLFLHHRRAARRATPALAAPEAPAAPPPGPHERALDRIARLREVPPRTREEIRAFHEEASRLVRDYLEERFAVPRSDSTEECLAEPRPRWEALPRVLLPCDLVKFACRLPDPEECGRTLAAAETFVEETA